MPSMKTIDTLKSFRLLRPLAQRLERRHFPSLVRVPKVQGRIMEAYRLAMRTSGLDGYRLSDQANRWLMRTMARECHRSSVTAVHAYEDCSLWQFEEAKRLGKACIYDMPTCYYPEWERKRVELGRTYPDWVPSQMSPVLHDIRLEQKRQEMALADL